MTKKFLGLMFSMALSSKLIATADNKLAGVLSIIISDVPELNKENQSLNEYFDLNTSAINQAQSNLTKKLIDNLEFPGTTILDKNIWDNIISKFKKLKSELLEVQNAHKNCPKPVQTKVATINSAKNVVVHPKAKFENWLKAISVVLKKNLSEKKSLEIVFNLRKVLPVNPSKTTPGMIIDKLNSILLKDLSKTVVEVIVKQCQEAVLAKPSTEKISAVTVAITPTTAKDAPKK